LVTHDQRGAGGRGAYTGKRKGKSKAAKMPRTKVCRLKRVR
jgi:hypothetical protein